MPYVSQAQRNFFNSPAGRRKIGSAEVDKWNAESAGHASNKRLPKKVPKRAGDPPDADLEMRPAVAPMVGPGTTSKLPTPKAAAFPKGPKMAGLRMAKPKSSKAIKPPAPAGSRTMARKPFGSMVPSVDDEGVGGLG